MRTPLAGQRLLLKNLVYSVVRPSDNALATGFAQAESLSDLVSDLLDVARIDGDAALLNLALVSVGDLVERALSRPSSTSAPPRPVRLRRPVIDVVVVRTG